MDHFHALYVRARQDCEARNRESSAHPGVIHMGLHMQLSLLPIKIVLIRSLPALAQDFLISCNLSVVISFQVVRLASYSASCAAPSP